MKISKLVSRKDGKVLVYDGVDPVCVLSLATIAKYDLHIEQNVEDEKLHEILLFDLEQEIFNKCCSYISSSPKTEKQIRMYVNKIIKRNQTPFSDTELSNTTENIIQKLKDYSYIDDKEYGRLFVASRIKNKPRGKNILIVELVQKGLDKETAEEIVTELVEDEYKILQNTYSKKYKEEPITPNDQKKIAFLLRKGFSWDLINQFIEEHEYTEQ